MINLAYIKDMDWSGKISFAKLKGRVSALVEIVGATAHVADIEVEIRILKEWLHSCESGLSFNACQSTWYMKEP
jgi:hypothetical protein